MNDFNYEVTELTLLYTVMSGSVVYVHKIISHSRENITINFFNENLNLYSFINMN